MWAGGVTAIPDEAESAVARQNLIDIASRIKSFAKSGEREFVYIVYADSSQYPIASDDVKNTKFLHQVANRYDPDRVFQ